MNYMQGTHCPLCGIRILGAHCRSKTCRQNTAGVELLARGFVSAGVAWSTLQRCNIELVRGTGNRNFAPEWAVRVSSALSPIYDENERDYDALRVNRHAVIKRIAAGEAHVKEAIVAAWALGGRKAVEKLVRGLAEEKGWK